MWCHNPEELNLQNVICKITGSMADIMVITYITYETTQTHSVRAVSVKQDSKWVHYKYGVVVNRL
jgi:hypothetical protein